MTNILFGVSHVVLETKKNAPLCQKQHWLFSCMASIKMQTIVTCSIITVVVESIHDD